ncbi:TonB-dependent siderophore receptor [Zavarzinia sp.]|uniref:TonB-dependent siderophore receptor n=1 Tax=Zavarzinia sp. TaxID=2027920 RepID=UPI003BB4CAEE
MSSVRGVGLFGPMVALSALAVAGAAFGQTTGEGQGETAILPTVTVEGETVAPEATDGGQGYRAPLAATAAKSPAGTLQTPQSTLVLTRQLMDDQGSRSLTDVLRNAAGVMPGGYYYGWEYVRIRGFDADDSIYIDGLTNGYGVGGALDLFLFDRVEVVRGPASTLYGASSLGGMVNLTSKRPVPDTFATIETTVGSQGDHQASIDAGALLSADGTLYGRFLFLGGSDASFIEDVDPSERVLVAPSLTWKPNDRTSLTLLATYSKSWDEGAPTLPAIGTVLPSPYGQIPLDRNLGEPDVPESVVTETKRIGYEFRHEFDETFAVRQSLRMNWFESRWRNILYPWMYYPDDRTILRFVYARDAEWTIFNTDTAAEARFATGPLGHFIALGVDYTRYQEDSIGSDFSAMSFIDAYDPVYNGTLPAQPLTSPSSSELDALGVYLQDQIRWNTVTLTLGGRFDRAKADESGDKSDDDKFSPKVGATWEFTPGFAVYANYAESFRPQPSTPVGSIGGPNAEPETGTNYEIGLKADSTDGTLGGTFAVYQLTRQNVASDTGLGFYAVTGEERSRGVELDLRWSPLDGLDLIGSYSYTDTEVTDDEDPTKVGDAMRNVPPHMVSGWAHYRLQEGPLEGLGFGLGVRHYTEQEGTLSNSFKLPAYTLVDAALSYEEGPFHARLNVMNLFDEEYYVGSYSDFYVLPGAPTEARLTVGYTF